MRTGRNLAIVGLVLIVLLGNTPLKAQEQDVGTDSHKVLITTNPFLFLFNWYNVELEVNIARHSTLGFAGSYVVFEADEDDLLDDKETYAGGSILYRYYAQGHAPKGFFFGGRLGIFSVELEEQESGLSSKGTTFGFGVEVGYNWLLGDTERFAIGIGAGAIRYFGGDLDDDAKTGLPIIRLVNVGFRF